MDADVKGLVGVLCVGGHGGGCWGGDQRDGNDDCHSEMRGSEPQDSVRS